MFDWLFTLEGWLSLATLVLLEIVLGIDNLVFLAVASRRLPEEERPKAQKIGLIGALVLRIGMLIGLVWITTHLTRPVFVVLDFSLSWRDLILLIGGLYLIWKATREIHEEAEADDEEMTITPKAHGFFGVVVTIMVVDMVFALDSIITAVAMTQFLPVMILANVVAIVVMMIFARPVSQFIERHLSIKLLALSFILLIGVVLVADGLHFHIPRGYVYFAILFSLTVEGINGWVRRRRGRKAQKISRS
ncbi:TerC family protein [Thermopetrobacter sp. TC1]|uniref:TerC family protein n=1 Tax=Thermopetrobacter sp. TC1 TaxID=1495045 RepID=UPI00056EE906|nr:TerC family protein [Thermopetrobacter sp. TC1]